ncbi:MAG: exo-alpha-sialidase [Chloroflexi bacterium]|nr:MAG: exo-alpha-sialidase [Chloroflexota bacterium]
MVSSVNRDLTTIRRQLLPVRRPATASTATPKPAGAARPSVTLPSGVGPNVQVSPTTSTDRFSETAVAADPTDPTGQRLAASANFLTSENHIVFASTSGGATWGSSLEVSVASPAFFADPGVAWDTGTGAVGSNHIYYSILGVDAAGNTELEFARNDSSNAAIAASSIDTSGDEPDKPMIATDPRTGNGPVYIGYDTNPSAAGSGQPLMVAANRDGFGFGFPVQVWNSGGDIGAWPAVAGNGTVYVVWDDYCGGTPSTVPTLTSCPNPSGQILLSKSADGGTTWLSAPVRIAGTTTGFGSILPNYATECTAGCPARPVGPQPQIAIDHSGGARNGTIYVVYADGADRQILASTVPSAHRMHIFLQESKDGGTTWSSRVQIDSGNTRNDSWEPSVAVDQSNGNVVLTWYDRRDDPNNKLYRPYYSESAADGSGLAQFTAQIPVADTQSDPSIDCNGTGDYLQIAAAAGTAHPLWSDTRTGLPAVFTSAITESAATTAGTVSSVTGALRDPHGTSWVGLPGLGSAIGVGADCQAWLIGLNQVGGGGGVWAWEGPGPGWVPFPGGGVRIATAAFGLPRIVNNANGIFFMRNDGSWQALAGAGLDVASGANISLWVIGVNATGGGYGLWFFNGGGWSPFAGGGVRLAIGPDGSPWVVNSAGTIWHWTGTAWQQLPGLAIDIGVGADGSAWIIGLNPVGGGFGIYRWSGTGWDAVPGGGIAISVGPDGLPWIVSSNGGIYERV